jgi:hypothetical protein
MKAAPKSQRAMYDEASRKSAEINETFLEMLPTMRRKDLERLIEKRPALWGRFAGYLTSGHVFVDDESTKTRHHATKKSPAQLQREIDEALAKPVTASGVPSALTRWEGSYSDVPLHSKYWYAVDQGTYHITPVSNPDQPRDVRYDLRFNKKPLGWEKIGSYYKTLRKAVSAAQQHYAALQ